MALCCWLFLWIHYLVGILAAVEFGGEETLDVDAG